MTVSEYVMTHHACAISDVPLEDAKRIAVEFPSANPRNDFWLFIERGLASDIVQMRFIDGSFYNWMNGPKMHYGIGALYSLSDVISFSKLEMETEQDEIDVSFAVLADIL